LLWGTTLGCGPWGGHRGWRWTNPSPASWTTGGVRAERRHGAINALTVRPHDEGQLTRYTLERERPILLLLIPVVGAVFLLADRILLLCVQTWGLSKPSFWLPPKIARAIEQARAARRQARAAGPNFPGSHNLLLTSLDCGGSRPYDASVGW
jgi:hypothetical protein